MKRKGFKKRQAHNRLMFEHKIHREKIKQKEKQAAFAEQFQKLREMYIEIESSEKAIIEKLWFAKEENNKFNFREFIHRTNQVDTIKAAADVLFLLTDDELITNLFNGNYDHWIQKTNNNEEILEQGSELDSQEV